MKLSLAWIFDHIKASRASVDIPQLIDALTARVAEVDSCRTISLDLTKYTLLQVTEKKFAQNNVYITGYSAEHDMSYTLQAINEHEQLVVGNYYVIYQSEAGYQFVRAKDVGGERDELLGPVWVPEGDQAGNWKTHIDADDVIIDVDNAALTHRPDLWGHRGMAREVAALIGSELLPKEVFFAAETVKQYDQQSVQTAQPFMVSIASYDDKKSLEVRASLPCNRLAGAYISHIDNKPSILPIAIRLAKIDARPHTSLVDMTNYVMFDLGQPMHAFDAARLTGKHITAQYVSTIPNSASSQKLVLLDGQEVDLKANDCVITDASGPIALAGIMGGAATAVTHTTTSLFLEAAHINPSVIRQTTLRLKKRTEASIRFEKDLDPNQNTDAILRYIKLLADYSIPYQLAGTISSVGKLFAEPTVEVSHQFIIQKLGTEVSVAQVTHILSALAFGVSVMNHDDQVIFKVTIPTFRATKDITIAEDIVEEIGRSIGYDTIEPKNCMRAMMPFDTHWVMQEQRIKQHMAYALNMRELASYAFYDEAFLQQLAFNPTDAVEMLNPLNIHNKRLVTSLVPHMLKAVMLNAPNNDQLRFFEMSRIWFSKNGQPVESLELASIIYSKQEPIDFYQAKAQINSIGQLLQIPITWRKLTKTEKAPWYGNEAAELYYENQRIGRAGIIATHWLQQVVDGYAFVCELDAAFLVRYHATTPQFKQLTKFQGGSVDISALVPLQMTFDKVQDLLRNIDPLVTAVELHDIFSKPEWELSRSLTVRIHLYNPARTLTGEEIEMVKSKAEQILQQIGAEIR